MASVKGGDKFKRAVEDTARALGNGGTLKVGFLEGATYPNGTPVALVAAIHNYGAPRANIPPRPFFTNMVKDKSKEWPAAVQGLLVKNKYDVKVTLQLTGEAIKGQLQQAIRDFVGVPLSPVTIARKGFDKQLIDTSHMLNSVSYEVKV